MRYITIARIFQESSRRLFKSQMQGNSLSNNTVTEIRFGVKIDSELTFDKLIKRTNKKKK